MSTAPVSKRKRDWFWVIRTLARFGISMADIARHTGRDVGTVKGWQNGSEPKESDARIMLALLAKYAPEEYLRHQREFDIRVTMEQIAEPGEQQRLAFVEVR